MPDQLKKSSSKRHRPKVPLEQRKRTVKAYTTCRLRKRRCVLVTPDRCQNCNKTNSSCVFEAENATPASAPLRYEAWSICPLILISNLAEY